MKSSASLLSQSTIAGFIGAAAFAVLTAGTAVAVSTTAVSITNPSTGKRAHVTNQQSLVISERDPFSGTYAKVDAAGRQMVGDGSGPFTVDGTVTARTSAPTNTLRLQLSGSMADGVASRQESRPLPTGATHLRMISMQVSVPSGQAVWAQMHYYDRATDYLSSHYVPVVRQGTFAGRDIYIGAMPLDLWPKPGTNVVTYIARSASTGVANFTTNISGVAL